MSKDKKETYGEGGEDSSISGESNRAEQKRTLIIIGEEKAGKSELMKHCSADLKMAEALFKKNEYVTELGLQHLMADFEAKEKTKYSAYPAELDEIFAQLDREDEQIAEIRQNTVRLGIETRSMLDDLRKQLG